jgi:hypothetical protein
MERRDGREKASLQVGWVDVLKAWAIYFLLKCILVILANLIGERLGYLVFSIEKGPSLKEGVEMGWLLLGITYGPLIVVAAFIFKWAVSRFVVSKIVQETPVQLSLFLYCRAWVLYAAITFVLGHLITLVLEYAILELILGSLDEAPWTEWLRRFVQPTVFTVVSLLVFRWAVIKLLLADRIARASSKAPVK